MKKLALKDLRIGMYVVLPSSWFSHSFIKNEFKIDSPELLKKILSHKFKFVWMDPEKSDIVSPSADEMPTDQATTEQVPTSSAELAYVSHNDKLSEQPTEQAASTSWSANNTVPPELLDAIEDKQMSAEVKSKVVYQHSLTLMKNLLDAPSTENIQVSKQAISSLTDLILAEDKTAESLMRITSHDFYTYTHSVNVGVSSILLAKALFKHSDQHDLHELGAGFFLHDLGKVQVRPEVLNKPARLSDSEMRHIRIHPYQGYKILKSANALSEECRVIVMQHHEFVDGTGYPRRLKDEEIHIYAKICALADVYDALTAERSYKKAMMPFDALQLMKKQMASHFDHHLFQSFVRLF